MDEATIADSLRPKQEPELSPPYPEPKVPDEQARAGQLPLESTQLTMELNGYFNLGIGAQHNADTQSQLNEIILWAKMNAETPDLAGILRTLRHTEVILGSTLKPDRMARLYRYVRIQQQKNLIAERERALYA